MEVKVGTKGWAVLYGAANEAEAHEVEVTGFSDDLAMVRFNGGSSGVYISDITDRRTAVTKAVRENLAMMAQRVSGYFDQLEAAGCTSSLRQISMMASDLRTAAATLKGG